MQKSFSDHNKLFKEKCQDVSIFAFADFNFIKTVQHGLVYSNRSNKGKYLKNYFHFPKLLLLLIYRLKFFLGKMKNERQVQINLKPVVFIDNGRERYDSNGDAVSMYYTKFYNLLDRTSFSVMLKKNYDILPTKDFDLTSLKTSFKVPKLSEKSKEVLNAIKKVQFQIKQSGKFTKKEIDYIAYFFHLFFQDFLFFDFHLSSNKVKTVFFDNHYHNEGVIAAFRMHNVYCIEIQHGLITNNDLYYVYPEFISKVASKAFFADKILVYGEYWKRKLLQGGEYSSEKIEVLGDYTYSKPLSNVTFEKSNIIFIGTQKFLGGFYVEYIKGLAALLLSKYSDWKIYVKLHPSELNKEQYYVLNEFSNVKIIGNESDLLEVLKMSKIQISYYSTTLFDAIGLGVLNFSIQNHSNYSDYCLEMLEGGIALPLEFDEDPIDKFYKNENFKSLDRNYVYAQFDEVRFKQIVQA